MPFHINSQVPEELLMEIFKLSAPKPIAIPWAFGEADLPWSLLRVCRKWRSTVLGMPELWTNIIIDYEDDPSSRQDEDDVDPDWLTAVAQKVLARGQDTSVSLSIVCDTCDWEDSGFLINLIADNAHRIRYLDLGLFEGALQALLAVPPINFEKLEFLSLGSCDEVSECVDSMAFQNTPRLVAAAFGVDLGWETTVPKLTWENLTDLAITEGIDLSPNVGHRILQHCPRLITLEISLFMSDALGRTARTVQSVTLPSLKTLLFNLSFHDTVADFLQPLTLPYLTRLEVVWLYDSSSPSYWNHAAALSVISGFTRLVKLKVGLPIPEDYDTGSFLASIPKVRKLDIGPLSRTSIRLLSSTEYLPHLQTLRAPITPKSTGEYLRMLEKRAEGGFKTRGVLVWPSSRVGKEFIANGDEKHLIEKLTDMRLLKLMNPHKINTHMRDLLSSRIQQWI